MLKSEGAKAPCSIVALRETLPMAMKVSCPNCLSLLQVPRKLTGKVVVCPCCKEKCRVPLPSTIGHSPAAATVHHGIDADAHAKAYNPAQGSWIRTAVVASIAAAVVAVGGLILWAAVDFRPKIKGLDASDSTADVSTNDASGGAALANGGAAAGANLAAQAEQVLRTHCHRCHGQDGTNEGGFNFVLRRDRLVSDNQFITPNKPDESYLLTRVTDNEMPPAGEPRPSQEEIDVLKRWIASGAPDFSPPLTRPFLSNADLVRFIRQDLETEVPQRDHRHTRYFTLVNLFNAGFSEDEMETYRHALSKLINSLSWHRKVVPPKAIDPHKTIFRIDVRALGWEENAWQAIIDANPYSVKMDEDDLDSRFCFKATQCELPHVRGDWFVAAASRPPLYHTVLQVPDTLKELLDKHFPSIDLEKDIQQESVVRAGFGRSGVSTHNRLLEWHHSPHGYFWVSYDFGADTGRKNLFSHPMGPGKSETDFDHDGGEIIFSLPNGLQGYMLVDGQGKRIDKGPTNIVSDPKRPDRAVTNGVSCMSCHYAGIIKKDDEIRKTVERNRTSFRSNFEDILALYPKKEELDELYDENATRFRKAVNEAGVKELTATGEPIVNMALRFETDVDAKSAAAELGLKLEDFLARIANNPRLQDTLGPLNVEGGTVKRDLFAKEFVGVVEELRLGVAFKPEKSKQPEQSKPAESAPKPPVKAEPKETAKPPATALAPGLRTWRDVKQNTSIEAEFVNLDGANVELRKADSSPVRIPLADLSPADRAFVDAEMKKRPNGSLPDAETPPGSPAPPPPSPGPSVPVGDDNGPAAPIRLWRNLNPRVNPRLIRGTFISLIRGDLKLSLANRKGVIITWPMFDLSPEDHDYVKSIVGEDHYKAHRDPPGAPPQPVGKPPY